MECFRRCANARHRGGYIVGRRAADAGDRARTGERSAGAAARRAEQGLAPLVVRELASVIRLLCGAGVTLLLVEQNMKLAEAVADELHIMVKGRMVYGATPEQFRAEEAEIRGRYLAV